MFDKKKKHDREFYSQTYWLKTNPTRSDHLTSTSRYFCNLQATMEHRQYENNLLKYTFEFIILSLYVSWFHYWSFLMWNTFGLSTYFIFFLLVLLIVCDEVSVAHPVTREVLALIREPSLTWNVCQFLFPPDFNKDIL